MVEYQTKLKLAYLFAFESNQSQAKEVPGVIEVTKFLTRNGFEVEQIMNPVKQELDNKILTIESHSKQIQDVFGNHIITFFVFGTVQPFKYLPSQILTGIHEDINLRNFYSRELSKDNNSKAKFYIIFDLTLPANETAYLPESPWSMDKTLKLGSGNEYQNCLMMVSKNEEQKSYTMSSSMHILLSSFNRMLLKQPETDLSHMFAGAKSARSQANIQQDYKHFQILAKSLLQEYKIQAQTLKSEVKKQKISIVPYCEIASFSKYELQHDISNYETLYCDNRVFIIYWNKQQATVMEISSSLSKEQQSIYFESRFTTSAQKVQFIASTNLMFYLSERKHQIYLHNPGDDINLLFMHKGEPVSIHEFVVSQTSEIAIMTNSKKVFIYKYKQSKCCEAQSEIYTENFLTLNIHFLQSYLILIQESTSQDYTNLLYAKGYDVRTKFQPVIMKSTWCQPFSRGHGDKRSIKTYQIYNYSQQEIIVSCGSRFILIHGRTGKCRENTCCQLIKTFSGPFGYSLQLQPERIVINGCNLNKTIFRNFYNNFEMLQILPIPYHPSSIYVVVKIEKEIMLMQLKLDKELVSVLKQLMKEH